MNRVPNAQLISLMEEANVSNKGLAKRMRDLAAQRGETLGTSHVSVQRWRDGSSIRPTTVAIMADVFSAKLQRRITPGDLGFFGEATASAPAPVDYPVTSADALARLDSISAEHTDTPENGRLIIADSDLNAAVLSWITSRPDGFRVDRPDRQRVGMRDVRAIRTAGKMFMELDFQFGGGHGHKALRHYFRHEVLPLLDAGYSEKVGTALFGAASEIAQLLGWTAYDAGSHQIAHRYLTSTLRLTQFTDDRMFGGRILSNLSHQANYLGNFAQSAQLARAALEGSKGRATPRAMAMFAAMEARALSSAGDHVAAGRAMNEAENYLERAEVTTDPDWLSYFTPAELMGEFCHCFRDLRRRKEALHHAQRAVDVTDPKYARSLGFCRMVLAQSQLLNGELEGALVTANLAVEAGDSLQSARFQRYVSDFQTEVSSHYPGNRAVTEFNDQVREALARLEEE